jgi:PAS domain-containing protein
MISKHLPHLTPRITPIASPALTHCCLLRELFGADISVIFIGPCAAKKNEADENPGIMNLALTFAELDQWLAGENIRPALLEPEEEDVFLPADAAEGALYPLEGGMAETMRHYGCPDSVRIHSLSGLSSLKNLLERARQSCLDIPLFLEGLACQGGCVNGPCSTRDPAPLEGMLAVRARARIGSAGSRNGLYVGRVYRPAAVSAPKWTESDMRRALARVGKAKADDELNCGGCGYETCRQFAHALLAGDAEPSMCVSHMRAVARRKANALLHCMPAGVVIVDEGLRIVESNEAFARIFGEKWTRRWQDNPGLADIPVEAVFPCGNLLRAALRAGGEIRRERLVAENRFLSVVIFVIEEHKTVGAIVEDVSPGEIRRDRIARRAREVINRNIATVQEIASRLGEHMADTEILLSSIADDYGDSAGDGDET